MTAFRAAVMTAILALGAPLPAPGQSDASTLDRAAVLVYRQALQPDGNALGLAARLITERAGTGAAADADTLKRLRDAALEAARGAERPVPTTPGAASDQVAALMARHVNAGPKGGPPRLLTAWRLRESRAELEGLLPFLLSRVEARAGDIWYAALEAAAGDEALADALAPLVAELAGAGTQAPLAEWLAVEPTLDRGHLSLPPGEGWLADARARLASALDDPANVSRVLTARLRAQWFLAARDVQPDDAGLALAGLWIGLRANTDGLATGNPVPFLMALVEGTQRLAVNDDPISTAHRRDLQATVELLDGIPADTVAAWTEVDRRLPGIFRSVLDELSQAADNEDGLPPSAVGLLMAGARLTLLDDDWEAYLMQPFREPIQQALAECLPVEDAPVSGCRVRFQEWGLQGAGIPEASGDVGGPFQTEYLLRELDLNPWQRVNYLRGLWRELLARDCTDRSRIRNAVEWALASRAYLETLPDGQAVREETVRSGLGGLADAGLTLTGDLKDFAVCRAQGRGPVRRVLAAYESAVNRLAGVLTRASRAFRDQVLVAGADIELDAGPEQETHYVPSAQMIGPCDATPSCGVSLNLPASETMYHRFPAAYRVADQSGLGSLSICYSDVSWVQRRAEPVKVGGGIMANYRGHLGFRLRGRYRSGGEAQDVFVVRMVTENAHTYLFAPDEPGVLADPCPQEYQGQMTNGELPEERGWLVPRRLTFLSGERTSPARLFAENWTRGSGWRDRLDTGDGLTVEKAGTGEEVAGNVAGHLERLRDRRRAYLYERLLAPMAADGESPPAEDLTATARELAAMRRALDASVRVIMSHSVMLDPRRRGVLYGEEALLGPEGIRAWREQGRDPMDLPDHARDRVDRAIEAWRLPSAGAEIPPFVANALIDLLAARPPDEAR